LTDVTPDGRENEPRQETISYATDESY
jgi:hypothetical protein